MSKIIKKFDEGFTLIKDEIENDIPLTCPVCEYFIRTDQDVFYYSQHKCCFECAVKWAEGSNRVKWKEGWRPDSSIIEEEKKIRRKLVTPIRFT